MKVNPVIAFPLSLFGILLMHLLALDLHLYWTVWWFDVLMHFLGGLWVGAFFLWLLREPAHSRHSLLAIAVLSALAIGVVWEIFEYLTGMTISLTSYPLDTATDIIMDVVGGFTAYVYLISKTSSKS